MKQHLSFKSEYKNNSPAKARNEAELIYSRWESQYDMSYDECPVCGSTNIREITPSEKAAGTIIFGLFYNTQKYQFECQNPRCKYRW